MIGIWAPETEGLSICVSKGRFLFMKMWAKG